jgi:hypothetical protein
LRLTKNEKGRAEWRALSVSCSYGFNYFFLPPFLAGAFFAAFFRAIPGTPFTFGLLTAGRGPPNPHSGFFLHHRLHL